MFATTMLKALVILIGLAFVAADEQEAKQSVAAANNAFAFDLYEVLRHREGNVVVSPLSAAAALTLTYLGAQGATAKQMQTALHLPESVQRIKDGYRALIDAFQSSDEMILRLANKVYADKRFAVKENFQQTAVDSFRAAAELVDFRFHPDTARAAINDWVEQITDHKIKELLPKGTVDKFTVLVLVNAIYFKGTWLYPFHKGRTRMKPFHLNSSEQKDVQTMQATAYFNYCPDVPGLPASAVELPYKGRNVRLIILRPNEIDGLSAVESQVRQLDLVQLTQCMFSREVAVSLPKFIIESTFQLHEDLPQLGIVDLFDKDLANFTGITDDQIFVSKVIQKAFMEVNENGTVAAAATAVIFASTTSLRPQPVNFRVDRPFFFILLDESNTVLFMGRTVKP